MSFSSLVYWRRTKFILSVLAAQVLLIATALALCVQLIFIATYGTIQFVEQNPVILYGEIAGTALITIYAALTFVNQWKRMGEKRKTDRED
jgi:hypothetical protein